MASEADLKNFLDLQGIGLFAAGPIREIKKDFSLTREMSLEKIDFAVSLAVPLPGASLEGISDRPTLLYKHIYRQANNLLDRAALLLCLWLSQAGHQAIPVPASQILDWEKNLAHLSHRQVAEKLGMGFYGRNNLLVAPGFGSRVRLATVLMDWEMEIPGPASGKQLGCGTCQKCVPVCPVSAIHTGPQDFDRSACFGKVKGFEKIRGIGMGICGICVKACLGPER